MVVADDAGLARSTDDAILLAAGAGVLRHAAVVANGPTAAEFVRRAADTALVLGWHVNLTQGRALAGPSSLTDAGGEFPTKHERWARADELDGRGDELRTELSAQRDRLAELGVAPAFVNGHNHVHVIPAVLDTLVGLVERVWFRRPRHCSDVLDFVPEAAVARMGGRAPHPPGFVGYAFSREPTLATLRDELATCGDARSVEWMTHPGARAGTDFCRSDARRREAELLSDPGLAKRLDDLGWCSVAVRHPPEDWR